MSQLEQEGRRPSADKLGAFALTLGILTREATAFLSRHGLAYHDGFSGISAQELYQLGTRIAQANSAVEVYNLLAGTDKHGNYFYDILIAPQHRVGRESIAKALRQYEHTRVERGIDFAAGTGLSTLLLAPVCRHITALDINPRMLQRADKRLHDARKHKQISSYDIQVADVTKFVADPSQLYDVAISMGMQAYLSYDEQMRFWDSLDTILKPGGRYYEFEADYRQADEYKGSPRAELAGLLAKMVMLYTYSPDHHNNTYTPHELPDSLKATIHRIQGGRYGAQVTRIERVR